MRIGARLVNLIDDGAEERDFPYLRLEENASAPKVTTDFPLESSVPVI